MFRNMVTSLLRHERIVTTIPKAKELRGLADRCITYAKKGSLHHRRLAARIINDPDVLTTLFSDYAERYADRPGGYTRIMKLGWRKGDAAKMAIIELMPEGTSGGGKRKRRKKADAATVEAAAPVTSKETFDEGGSVEEALDGSAAEAVIEAPAAEAEPAAEAPAAEAEAEPAAEAPAAEAEPAAEAPAAEAEPAAEAAADEAAADEEKPAEG
jgi:large subunit ribosomal protein L17